MTQDDAELLTGYKFTPGWEFIDIKRNGELSGFVMKQGNELHVFRVPKYSGRWFYRNDLENIFNPVLREFGEVVTKVRKSNEGGMKFCKRIGFEVVGSDENVINMRLTRIQHARN